jgi:fused signal recognition particle receptor
MSEGQKSGWFARLKAGLSRSSGSLKEQIASVVTRRRLDAAVLEELEEALIMADLGVDTAAVLVKAVAKDRFGRR